MKVDKLQLVVFDLDYTLWPFWVDTHVDPPFRKSPKGTVVDRRGTNVDYYPEVPQVLEHLKKEGYTIAVASRTGEIKGARQLIDLFGWDKYFTYKEIFPGSKTTHFQNLKKASGLEYNQMIFFDDEHRNIRDVGGLGVVSILAEDGVSKKLVECGIDKYVKQNGYALNCW